MFTGIVESTGKIVSTRRVPHGLRIAVECPPPMARESLPGASICVSGVCLTVVGGASSHLEFDVVSETLRCTMLGDRRAGDRVNLERALRAGDRIDGHFVQGHIDGTALVDRVIAGTGEYQVWLQAPPSLLPYLVPKGSIALDGVSLTIAELDQDAFSVALIPTTLERTTLSDLRNGVAVNLETDLLARAVVHSLSLQENKRGLSVQALREARMA